MEFRHNRGRGWALWFDDSQFGLRTPWFCFHIGYGAKLFTHYAYWWGIRFDSSPVAVREPGRLPFERMREITFRLYPGERAARMGGPPL